MWDVWNRGDLLASGWSPRKITAAVRSGHIQRPRQGCYVAADAPAALVKALRVGGRLSCISLLAALEVFVFDSSVLHVHVSRGASRLRSATSVRTPLAARRDRVGTRLHWHTLIDEPTEGAVGMLDALVHSVRCQQPRHAVATLDSALHRGLIAAHQLADVFAALPARFAPLMGLIDARAESGPETLVRLIARSLGFRVDLQVRFDEIGGRVDLLLDGWLVVECDSKAFHSSWAQQRKDHRRDRRLAALGYSVLRLAAEDVLYQPESVVEALRGLRRPRRFE